MRPGGVEPPTSRLSGDELGVGKSDEMPSFPRQLAHSAGIPFPENRSLPAVTDTVTDTVHETDREVRRSGQPGVGRRHQRYETSPSRRRLCGSYAASLRRGGASWNVPHTPLASAPQTTKRGQANGT